MKKLFVTLIFLICSLSALAQWETISQTNAFGEKTGKKYMLHVDNVDGTNYLLMVKKDSTVILASTSENLSTKLSTRLQTDTGAKYKMGGDTGNGKRRIFSNQYEELAANHGLTHAQFINLMKKSKYVLYTFLTEPYKKPVTIKIDCMGFTKQYNALTK